MDAKDTRGAGGRAPRVRGGSTPGRLIGLVASPLQLISKTVKGLVGTPPGDSINQTGAAARKPSPPPQNQQIRKAVQLKSKVEDGPSGFSFPTLAGSDDSPPTNSLSRPVSAAAATAQQQRAVATPDVPLGQVRQAGLSPNAPGRVPQDGLSGWSPSKLASLNFFMKGAKSGADAVQPAVHAAVPSANEPGSTSEPPRPYFNLTSILRAGPGGLVSGANAGLGAAGVASRPSAGTARYNPYGRVNLSKPPRPVTAGLPSAPQPSTADIPATGFGSEAGQQPPQTGPKPSMAVATARLPPPNARTAPAPMGIGPRPPTAPGALRLAPGQVAFSSGRTGTPLPKFGPLAAVGQGTQHQQTPSGFRPIAGAIGGKRQRDSPAVSPLMASGIRNLSEFKRRRQAQSLQPRSVLAGFSARTPRENTPLQSDNERTPGGGSGGSGATVVTPGPSSGGGVAGELPATETARKILETLDNFKRTGDANTSNIMAGKPVAQSGARTGPPTGSPFPGPFMPPLDRLDQNHYGGTPTPSITTVGPGFVCGATPSSSGNAGNVGQTPGPRMVLEFNTPVVPPAHQSLRQLDGTPGGRATTSAELGINTLPLSPIAVPHVAATTDRVAHAGSASAPVVEAPTPSTAEARNRIDAPAPASTTAGGTQAPPEPTSTSSVANAVFRSPRAPLDQQLQRAKDVCEAHAALAANSSDLEVVVFRAATVGADGVVSMGKSIPVSPVTSTVAEEIAKAAALPLPDDSDDETVVDTTAASAVAVTAGVDARTECQATKAFQCGGTRRVAFADQPESTPAEKRKDSDAQAKAATPLATPGVGVFFSSHAGSTPFTRFSGADTPANGAGEKMPNSGNEETSDAGRPYICSFGPSTAAPVVAPADGARPSTTQPLGSTPTPTSFSWGAAPKEAAPSARADATAILMEKAEPDKERVNPENALITSGLAKPNPVMPEVVTVQPTSTGIGQFAFGAPTAASQMPNIASKAPSPEPAFALAATVAPAVEAMAAPSGTAPSAILPTFGAPSSSMPAVSSAPAFSGSAPANVVSTSAPPGFAFNALASGAAPSSAAASLSSAAAASFTFGATQSLPLPPASFGSPMPVSNSSAPMFGATQLSAGSLGFGTGSFGAASGPAVSFTFGAAPNSGSSSLPASVSGGGFGTQQSAPSPASTFNFGSASAPTFSANAPAPSFGAPPAPQPSFGTAAPSFGAPAPANPFGAAAPSFGAPTSQPAFGAAPANSTPAFGASAAPAAVAPNFGGFGSNSCSAPAGGMFTFGGSPSPPAATPAFGQAAPTFGVQAQPTQAPAPVVGGFGAAPASFVAPSGYGAVPPQGFGGVAPSPGGDAGGGFSLGLGDPKDGRKRVKARRHGH